MTAIAWNELPVLASNVTLNSTYQSFADVGYEIPTSALESFMLCIDLDINSAIDVQFQLLGKNTLDATDEFNFVNMSSFATVATAVRINPLVYEVNSDVDQKIMIPIENKYRTNYMQLQAKVPSIAGTSAILVSVAVIPNKKSTN